MTRDAQSMKAELVFLDGQTMAVEKMLLALRDMLSEHELATETPRPTSAASGSLTLEGLKLEIALFSSHDDDALDMNEKPNLAQDAIHHYAASDMVLQMQVTCDYGQDLPELAVERFLCWAAYQLADLTAADFIHWSTPTGVVTPADFVDLIADFKSQAKRAADARAERRAKRTTRQALFPPIHEKSITFTDISPELRTEQEKLIAFRKDLADLEGPKADLNDDADTPRRGAWLRDLPLSINRLAMATEMRAQPMTMALTGIVVAANTYTAMRFAFSSFGI